MRHLVPLLALAVLGCSQRTKEVQPAAPAPAPVAPAPAPAPAPVAPAPLADHGAGTRIFGPDVPTDTLALSIAIETLGGAASVILPRGSRLPAEHREVFSTAADDQASVELHIVQGERPFARDNRTLGKFQLTGIPPAPRGVPQIEATFVIDATGVLTVSAKDRATGAYREVRIEAAQAGALDNRAVEQVLASASAHRAKDDVNRDRLAAGLELQTLLYSSRKLIAEAGAKLPAALRERCEREIQRAGQIDPSTSAPAAIRAATSALRAAIHAATTSLYAKPG
jgi:molecular chaperone DnaK